MLKTKKKPVIDGLKSKNKITPTQAKIAYIIQHIYLTDSRIGSGVDSTNRIFVDGGDISLNSAEKTNNTKFWQKAKNTKDKWEETIKQGHMDPIALQITKSILHYNIAPSDIAIEFTEQLYQKSSGHLLKRFNIKISTYKVENMFKQALDLFIQIGDY